MNAHTRSLVAGGAALVLAACATELPPADINGLLAERGYAAGEAVREIRQYRINGWQSLDTRHVIIDTGPSTHYLLTLMSRCDALRTAETIGFSTTSGNLTTFDKLVVRDSGNLARDCPITKIQQLDETEK